MPEITFANREALPEELRTLAKDADGGAVVINLVPNERLKEFRDKNVELVKERDALNEKVTAITKIFPEGFDPAKATTEIADLRATAKRVKDGDLTESKAIEEAVNDRTREMRSNFESQISAQAGAIATAKAEKEAAEARLRGQIVRQAVTSVALDEKVGVAPSAVEDIISRAKRIFTVDGDENLVPKQNGTILYGADGATPMTPFEWVSALKANSPHLFKQSGGGGGETRTFGGFTAEQIAKLSPEEKMRVANEQSEAKRAGKRR